MLSNNLALVTIALLCSTIVHAQQQEHEIRIAQLERTVSTIQAEVELLRDVLSLLVGSEVASYDSPVKRVGFYGSRGKRVPYLGSRGKRVDFLGSRGKRVSFYGNRG